MGMKYVDQDDILIEKLHQGSHQDFYRTIISRGIKQIKKEWEEKKYELENPEYSKLKKFMRLKMIAWLKEYETQDDN